MTGPVRLPGRRRLRVGARWLRSRLRPRALVLGYHRVDDEPEDPFGLRVSPQNFGEQMDVLCRTAWPFHLPDLVAALGEGWVPDGGAAVTFDDGYADTIRNVLPVLEAREVPATVFVVAGCLGREPWWERLARLLRDAPVDGAELHLHGDGAEFRWSPRAGHPGAAHRDGLLWALHAFLAPLDEGARDAALAQLDSWTGAEASRSRAGARLLSPGELKGMPSDGILEFGAHSVSHPPLARLPRERQHREAADSKKTLEAVLGREIQWFSYPHGSASSETQDIVRACGYAAAWGSVPDVVRTGANPFRLPRMWVGDWDGERFRRWLSRWL